MILKVEVLAMEILYSKSQVGYWMSREPKTVSPDTSVRRAFFKMRYYNFRHLPVVKDGKLVGIVSDRDLRRPDVSEEPDGWDDFYRLDDSYEVCDVMATELITLRPRDTVRHALSIFLSHRFGALPVLNVQGELVGILTARDMFRAFDDLLAETGGWRRGEEVSGGGG
ncbi:MAG: CBS domain-containing protein [Planctomycetota bacterium]|nr:MAG: CBS domain-containing protein [Planctomycetota bacterium]